MFPRVDEAERGRREGGAQGEQLAKSGYGS